MLALAVKRKSMPNRIECPLLKVGTPEYKLRKAKKSKEKAHGNC